MIIQIQSQRGDCHYFILVRLLIKLLKPVVVFSIQSTCSRPFFHNFSELRQRLKRLQ